MSGSNFSSILRIVGANGFGLEEREENDYYATDPNALELLLKEETFSRNVWEPACGGGHLAKVLVENGYNVLATDLVDRGYGKPGIDFLKCGIPFDGDIITNPPFKYALEFTERALDLIPEGNKVAMFLKLTFLEGQKRRAFFKKHPPKRVYVFSKRTGCAKNGEFEKYGNHHVAAYAWYVWEKDNKDDPRIKWIN